MELRWTGSSGKTRGETPHSCPPFGLYSKWSGLSSVLGLEQESLFVSGQITGQARDACASLFFCEKERRAHKHGTPPMSLQQ